MGCVVPFPVSTPVINATNTDEARLAHLCRMAKTMRQAMLEAIYFSDGDVMRRRLRGALLVLDMLHDEELQDIELGV